MKNIYFFSGLGADERVFQNLDFTSFHPVFIKWIEVKGNESIESYALRLTAQIKDENPVLVGVSFGGMIAVEVSKLISTEKVILISSAKTKHELPRLYKLAGNLRLQKLIPFKQIKRIAPVNNYFFGVKSKAEKKLLNKVISDTDPVFIKWAINKIVTWKNKFIPENITHIHGDKDHVLSIKFVKPDYVIENGGHFLISQQSEQINRILKEILSSGF